MTRRARIAVLVVAATFACACGRRVELEGDSTPGRDGGAGTGGLAIDAPTERITPDGPVPVVEDSGLSLDAGDGCGARLTACPSQTDFPCGKIQWFAHAVAACRESAGCVEGFVTFRIADGGCVSELGMTHENRAFVDCLAERLNVERCPCLPSLETVYLGDGC